MLKKSVQVFKSSELFEQAEREKHVGFNFWVQDDWNSAELAFRKSADLYQKGWDAWESEVGAIEINRLNQ